MVIDADLIDDMDVMEVNFFDDVFETKVDLVLFVADLMDLVKLVDNVDVGFVPDVLTVFDEANPFFDELLSVDFTLLLPFINDELLFIFDVVFEMEDLLTEDIDDERLVIFVTFVPLFDFVRLLV